MSAHTKYAAGMEGFTIVLYNLPPTFFPSNQGIKSSNDSRQQLAL